MLGEPVRFKKIVSLQRLSVMMAFQRLRCWWRYNVNSFQSGQFLLIHGTYHLSNKLRLENSLGSVFWFKVELESYARPKTTSEMLNSHVINLIWILTEYRESVSSHLPPWGLFAFSSLCQVYSLMTICFECVLIMYHISHRAQPENSWDWSIYCSTAAFGSTSLVNYIP